MIRLAAPPFLLIPALVAIAAAVPAAAQSERYRECLEQARDQPARAREAAAQWRALGGGAEAKHCAAIALIGMGAERHAAILLTEVGTESGALSAADRAGALLLAGDLWLRLERIDLAEQSYDRALTLSPSDPEAMIGLAKAKARPGDYAAAEALLTRALDVRPLDPQALIL
ncbi:MAG: tetratricopeptide repeat protein, partial [Pseudomonadota bacterium]